MIPQNILSTMRTLLEGAPPLAYHAAAVFLKREEPRWMQLAENTDLLEERFVNFLDCPSSWDMVQEHLQEAAPDWKETRCEKCKGLPDGKCPACGGKGWAWMNTKTGQKDLSYGNPVKYGRVQEDAPANAAGNAGVAGIGQPEGSKFGEPGFALGGATTKTKKKNKRPDDIEEGNAADVIPKADPNRVIKVPSEAHYDNVARFVEQAKQRVARLTALLKQEKDPISLATLRASLAHAKQELAVHEKELAKIDQEIKRYRVDAAAGITRDGKSALHESTYSWVCQKCGKMWGPADDVPKKCPRCGSTDAKRRDDAELDEETFAGAPVFEVPMDKWMASRFGKKRYHRYSRYVGNDPIGETIRQHGRKSKEDIILKDQTTGVMTYLRRKAVRG